MTWMKTQWAVRSRRSALIGLVLLPVLPLGVAAAGGGPGSLDRSFGKGGVVTTKIGSDDAKFGSLALQKDGKLVAAGGSTKGLYGDDSGSDGSFVLVRYGANGSLDRSFGSGGIVKTPSGPAAAGHDPTGWATALVIQPDGKLVAAGSTAGATCGGFLVVQYQPTGALNRSFGSGGKIASDTAVLSGLAVQPDGKLLLASLGDDGCDINSPGVTKLSRYNPNGTLDRSFGTGGTVTTRTQSGPVQLGPLVIQQDGKVVAVSCSFSSTGDVYTLVRYNANGSLDRGFGKRGKVRTPTAFNAVSIQPDGKVVAVGSRFNGSRYAVLLARYNASGTLDRSFGRGGIATTVIRRDALAAALVIQADGKLVIAGENTKFPFSKGSVGVFALARYNADGSLDHSFGSAGIVKTPIGADSGAAGLVIQPDDKLVAAGHGKSGSRGIFALSRYQG